MHSDGIVYESDLLLALGQLADRVDHAQRGDGGELIDVVCLALGYFSETQHDKDYTVAVAELVDQLTAMGVVVVAAAGNHATTREFYPAALAATAGPDDPLVSIGALNPNGSKAMFSDDAAWVGYWASGAALVSTFPAVRGSSGPVNTEDASNAPGLPQRRETLDGDDYSGGFATWSGTSFAAGLGAADVAAGLVDQAVTDPALSLDATGRSDMIARAAAALDAITG
jgi:hypothetical protein